MAMTDDERQIRTLVDTWMAASKAGEPAHTVAAVSLRARP
jgi:hypothetical protein